MIHVSGLSETGGNLTSYNATPGYAPDYQHDRYYNVTDLQFNYRFDIVEIHNTDSETSSVDLNLVSVLNPATPTVCQTAG